MSRANRVNYLLSSKKSQITVFVIVGIIIIALVGIMFYLLSPNINLTNSKTFGNMQNTNEIKIYFEKCMEGVIEESIGEI